MVEKEILLIVDDMDVACKSLADILTIDGYSVKTATSGMDALDIVKDGRIDCVITDIKMPEMNGVELLKEIKVVEPALPVMLMTAYANDELVEKGMHEGALTTFYKPLDINDLRRQIAIAVR